MKVSTLSRPAVAVEARKFNVLVRQTFIDNDNESQLIISRAAWNLITLLKYLFVTIGR
jgi:hypothetical protein